MSQSANREISAGADLSSHLEPLYSAVVADVLDSMGYREQVLDCRVRPLTPNVKVFGRVFPARAEAVTHVPEEPYQLEIGAVEAMNAGDVLVVDAQFDQTCGFWGELLTTACLAKGIRGVVMTACTRDLWKLKSLSFPIFGIGYHPADSKGRADIVAIGQSIQIGGVAAKRGDYLLGDEDGVVIIPEEIAAEAIRLACDKASGENVVRAELARGVPIGEVFKRHGIL